MATLVSIVVVNFNKADLTGQCLAAIDASMGDIDYETIVIDNGSNPNDAATVATLASSHGATFIPLRCNLFFGEANNIGAEAASGTYLLLLNNDAFLQPGAVARLLDTLTRAPAAGAVGPRFLYPDGRLQELGAYVRPDGWVIQAGRASGRPPPIPARDVRVVDYCSAACLLMRRDTFLALGGFDPAFDPAYYEDVDLALRLRASGKFFYLDGRASVIHAENQTATTIWSNSAKLRLIKRNRRIFMGRWGRYLRSRPWYDARPPVFPTISWTPEPALADRGDVLVIEGPGRIDARPIWRRALELVARLEMPTVFLADEACSRCRVFTLAAFSGIKKPPFRVRRVGSYPVGKQATRVLLEPGFLAIGKAASRVETAWLSSA